MDFTDDERGEIAAEHDQVAASLWPQVRDAERRGQVDLACRLRQMACDAMDVAQAARTSAAALSRVY
ncbi:hypothetical protein [Streptomyces sp. NPDC020983]|uniref:hypothetical protein n=1 Tax=Streptomyces sp. NPDC020983 TaxID=3365106 RepID=UPI00378B2629